MRTCRIHIVGAAGAGTTTLGRALASTLAASHHDTDDYFWLPTTPPYRQERDVADRVRLMREVFLDRSDWVLSGSLDDWGCAVVPLFDLVVFVQVPTAIRVQRLREREALHFGRDATSPGGWRHRETEDFIDWASHYDYGTNVGRSLPRHLAWLGTLTCPVMRIDGTRPIADLVDAVIAALRRQD
jgi:adenylate kinase family enzyme